MNSTASKSIYVIDPYNFTVQGWQRENDELVPINDRAAWVSPRLSIRFEATDNNLRVIKPKGSRFLTYLEANADAATARSDTETARTDTETARADTAVARAAAALANGLRRNFANSV